MVLSFLFNRKSKGKTDALFSFLNEADDELMNCFECRSLNKFIKYADNKVLRRLSEQLNAKEEIFFGIEEYRTRTWTIINSTPGEIIVKKMLRHQHVKISKSIYVSIGEDLDQLWTVSTRDGYIVREIADILWWREQEVEEFVKKYKR